MKKALLYAGYALCLSAVFVSCSNDDDNDPAPTPTNPYYFNFTLNGTVNNFASPLHAQYVSSDPNVIGGYQEPKTGGLFPSIRLSFNYDHHPTESEVLDLAGKTLHFDDVSPEPYLEYSANVDDSSQYWTADAPNTSNHYVKINSISYVRTDTTIFNIVDVYVINGTCNTLLRNVQNNTVHPDLSLTDGNFNFLISRVK